MSIIDLLAELVRAIKFHYFNLTGQSHAAEIEVLSFENTIKFGSTAQVAPKTKLKRQQATWKMFEENAAY